MEYKTIDTPEARFEFKAREDDPYGMLMGYASTFHNFDLAGERPQVGAFSPHLAAFLKDGFIAFGHNWYSLPIGLPVTAYEDDHGLLIETAFHTTAAAQDSRKTIQERLALGKSVKLSIGYEVLRSRDVAEGRILEEIKLYEVSYVLSPMNPLADVLSAKRGYLKGALPLTALADAVETASQMFLSEAVDLKGRRLKEGRVLSDANRKRVASLLDSLKEVIDSLDSLLRDSEPKASAEETQKLYAQFQQLQFRLTNANGQVS